MKEQKLDTSILDKAISFAAKAHSGVVRKGTNIPYITHPIEVVTLISTMTDDIEVMAAGALHDVIEDTDITKEEIEKEFGKRIADIVDSESDTPYPELDRTASWMKRKEETIFRLKESPIESKIVALGDKLSNIRAIYRDYKAIGDELWNRFNIKDKSLQKWYYTSLLNSLEDLKSMEAYKEFEHLVLKVFER